nr:hypothetical protein CFP56_69947 [Quercus suber]
MHAGVCFEGDSVLVVKSLRSGLVSNEMVGHLVKDIMSIRGHFQSSNIIHGRRQGNNVAHALARDASFSFPLRVWMEEVPANMTIDVTTTPSHSTTSSPAKLDTFGPWLLVFRRKRNVRKSPQPANPFHQPTASTTYTASKHGKPLPWVTSDEVIYMDADPSVGKASDKATNPSSSTTFQFSARAPSSSTDALFSIASPKPNNVVGNLDQQSCSGAQQLHDQQHTMGSAHDLWVDEQRPAELLEFHLPSDRAKQEGWVSSSHTPSMAQHSESMVEIQPRPTTSASAGSKDIKHLRGSLTA